MDIKETLTQTAKSAKFEGVTIDLSATADSRFAVTVHLKGSVDLPGDFDATLAGLLHGFGLGKSSPSV